MRRADAMLEAAVIPGHVIAGLAMLLLAGLLRLASEGAFGETARVVAQRLEYGVLA